MYSRAKSPALNAHSDLLCAGAQLCPPCFTLSKLFARRSLPAQRANMNCVRIVSLRFHLLCLSLCVECGTNYPANSSQQQPLPLRKHPSSMDFSFSLSLFFFSIFFSSSSSSSTYFRSSVICVINSENEKENYNSFLIISIFHYHSRVSYFRLLAVPLPSN